MTQQGSIPQRPSSRPQALYSQTQLVAGCNSRRCRRVPMCTCCHHAVLADRHGKGEASAGRKQQGFYLFVACAKVTFVCHAEHTGQPPSLTVRSSFGHFVCVFWHWHRPPCSRRQSLSTLEIKPQWRAPHRQGARVRKTLTSTCFEHQAVLHLVFLPFTVILRLVCTDLVVMWISSLPRHGV